MTKRKRGERIWDEPVGDHIEHQPKGLCDELEQTVHSDAGEIVYVHGHPYIKAADGKLEAVED